METHWSYTFASRDLLVPCGGFDSKRKRSMLGQWQTGIILLIFFGLASSALSQSTEELAGVQQVKALPPLPIGVTSFGAAVIGDWVYIYGGHTGKAHDYYRQAQSNTLRRLSLVQPTRWEKVATGPHLQGLAMVAWEKKLYRLGGFTAKNQKDEEEDLWSVPDVALFDPKTGDWQDLPPMPVPRSSFDAVVHEGQIYVAGGWALQGGRETKWHDSAYVLNLKKLPLQWEKLPGPPFRHRAVSLGSLDDQIYVVGGMNQKGPTMEVYRFDVQARSWQAGPNLIGEGMDGFGSATFAQGDQLYVSTYSGGLLKLNADHDGWVVVKNLSRARFFHRMLPIDRNLFALLGGASMKTGKFSKIELLKVAP